MDTGKNALTNILPKSQSNHLTIKSNHHGIPVAEAQFAKYALDLNHRLRHPKDRDINKRVLSAAVYNLRWHTVKTFQHQMDSLAC